MPKPIKVVRCNSDRSESISQNFTLGSARARECRSDLGTSLHSQSLTEILCRHFEKMNSECFPHYENGLSDGVLTGRILRARA